MKPIPAPPVSPESPKTLDAPSPLSGSLSSAPGTWHSANRRSSHSNVPRAYPWLLLLSTATAGFFCLMYIKKPLLPTDPISMAHPHPATTEETVAAPRAKTPTLLPDPDSLPGTPAGDAATTSDGATGNVAVTAPMRSAYEETNLRVQHILTAEAPGGHISRIDIEVPVLYQSRNLRWNQEDAARARDLMLRLMDYQDKTRELRAQGEQLLTAWNELVGGSIPADLLRADSPSLPENQHDATTTEQAVDTTTREAIRIESSQ